MDKANDLKKHWDEVYNYRQPDEVSWTKELTATSLYYKTSSFAVFVVPCSFKNS
jgi:hypothetical protein